MKKAFRILGIIVLLLIGVIIALPFFLKDRIADEIKKAINEQVNAEVYFADVSISLIKDFPKLSLEIDSLRISNLAPFEGVDLVNVGKLSTSMNLLSAFGSEIKVLNIALENPSVDIRVLEDGTANYDIAKASDPGTETTTESEPSNFKLNLKEYSISHGEVSYVDESMPLSLVIRDLNHRGSGDFTSDQFILETISDMASLDFEFDGVKYMRKVKTDIKANLDMNLSTMNFVFSENSILLNGLLLEADGYVKMPGDDIEMDIKFGTPGSDFKQLLSMVPAEFASSLEGVDASGTMSFKGFVRGVYNENSLPGFGLDLMVKNGRFKYPDLPSSAENIQVQASIDASDGNDYDKMSINVPQFHVELAENPIDIQLALLTPMSDPDIDLKVQSQLDLGNIGKVVPMEGNNLKGRITADFALDGKLSSIETQAYDKFKADGQLILQEFFYSDDSLDYDVDINLAYLNFSPQYLDLTQFKAQIGKSDFSANGKIENYIPYYLRDTTISGRFNFNSKLLDLNEFMSSEESETASTDADSTVAMEALRLPKNIDFTLNASITELLYDNLNIKDISGSLSLQEGVASLKGMKMSLMDGTVEVSGDYDSRPENPFVDFIYDVRNFDIQKTAAAFNTVDKLAPIAKKCKGKFSTRMNFETSLNNQMEPIEETMEGRGTLQTKEIYVEGFEPLMKVADAVGIEKLAKQNINDINLTYVIQDGKAIVDPFDIELEGITTTIYGHTTFDAEIDYFADMQVPMDKLPSKVGSQASKLTDMINSKLGSNISAGTVIPVKLHITGTVEKPVVASDIKQGAKDAVKTTIEDVKEQVKEEVKEIIDNTKEEARQKAREEADKILADAQKQADKLVADARVQSEKLRTEGYKQAKDLEDKAKNPLEKAGARIAADKLRKETDNSANKVVTEAQKQADSIMADARKRADEKLKSVE